MFEKSCFLTDDFFHISSTAESRRPTKNPLPTAKCAEFVGSLIPIHDQSVYVNETADWFRSLPSIHFHGDGSHYFQAISSGFSLFFDTKIVRWWTIVLIQILLHSNINMNVWVSVCLCICTYVWLRIVWWHVGPSFRWFWELFRIDFATKSVGIHFGKRSFDWMTQTKSKDVTPTIVEFNNNESMFADWIHRHRVLFTCDSVETMLFGIDCLSSIHMWIMASLHNPLICIQISASQNNHRLLSKQSVRKMSFVRIVVLKTEHSVQICAKGVLIRQISKADDGLRLIEWDRIGGNHR